MRMPLLAIAALAIGLSPALAQTVLTVPDQTPNAEVTGQTPEQAPPAQLTEPAAPVPAAPPEQAKAPEPPPTPAARYSLTRVDDGYLRLDGETGQVAFCSARGAGWACQVVPEDRAAFEQEIARLQDRVAALEKDLADLREPPPPRPPADLAPAPPAADKGNDVAIKLPTQEDIDRAGAALQSAWKRLVDMLVGFKNDMMRKG
jgi:hypothetical protein